MIITGLLINAIMKENRESKKRSYYAFVLDDDYMEMPLKITVPNEETLSMVSQYMRGTITLRVNASPWKFNDRSGVTFNLLEIIDR